MTAIGTVVSARTASIRLPAKAFRLLDDVPMIVFLLERLRSTRKGGKLIFATTQRRDDDKLAELVGGLGIPVFRGADSDVADRYLAAAKEFGLEFIVRVTGDCPFVDADSLDACIAQWSAESASDIFTTKGVFPVGIDFELFSTLVLEREWPKMTAEEREHLTLRFYRQDLGFSISRFEPPADWPVVSHPFVVDTIADLKQASRLVSRLGRHFTVRQLLDEVA